MEKYLQIKKIGKVITGKTPSTEDTSNFGGKYPFITPSDIKSFDEKYLLETERTLSEEGAKKLKNNILPKDTICFVCIGSTIGKMCLTNTIAYSNQQINSLIVNNNFDAHYMFYFLRYVKSYFKQLGAGTGSGKGIVNKTTFEKSKVKVETNKDIQVKMANILSVYDNLIENNNKRIKLLEQMAENLYKEWFVRFRFPGYEDTEFEDGMPRGWVREKIGLHYNTCSGGTPSRKHEEYYTEGTIPWVKTGEIKDGIIIHTDECITEAGIKGSSAKLLPQGAVVMAMYGVNIGMLAYLDSEMTCNQACCVFNDKNEINSRHYLFHYLYSIRDYLLLIGFGAAQQNLSQDLIKKVKIVIPPAELIKEFDKQKEPLYQTIRALMMQNDKLIKQRDALLPRLMSGKLEV